MNRWLKKCTQLTVRNLNDNRSIFFTDGSVVRINLIFFLSQFLNFYEFNVLDAEPGIGSEFAIYTFVSTSCW